MTENFSKISEEFTRWKEVLGLSLIAFLGWIFRLGRLEQRREDRIGQLEQWRAESEDRIDQMVDDVSEIRAAQIEQAAELRHIAANVGQLRQDLRDLAAARRPGGARWYDPPEDDR